MSPSPPWCTLSHVAASASGISDRLTRDVTDGPKAHRNLNMPSNHTIGLRTHGKQVHFAEAVLDAANRKVAISIEPLLNETFGE
jgi:hypothetical protein